MTARASEPDTIAAAMRHIAEASSLPSLPKIRAAIRAIRVMETHAMTRYPGTVGLLSLSIRSGMAVFRLGDKEGLIFSVNPF
jgi:hypothetical protein